MSDLHPLSNSEIRSFLTEGTRTAKLAYLSPTGRLLVAPVWFIIENDDLIFDTGADSVKGRYLAQCPQVTICVDLEHPPFGFVQIQGTAELSEDPHELLRTATAIAARYVEPERVEEFAQRNGGPGGLVVRVRAAKVLAYFNLTTRHDYHPALRKPK